MPQTHTLRSASGFLVFAGSRQECQAVRERAPLTEAMEWRLNAEPLCDKCDRGLAFYEEEAGRCLKCRHYVAMGCEKFIERGR